MAVSNNIMACLNFASLLASIPIIGAGIWIASQPENSCLRLFRWPIVILGTLLLLVSLAGFVGAYWNRECLLATYLFVMAGLIFLFLVLLVFAFVLTRPSGALPSPPGRGFDEYALAGFSPWLRRYISDSGHWAQIRSCLAGSDTCPRLARTGAYMNAEQFFMAHLSPLQSGCCKPPTGCGYSYVNPTVWTNPSNPAAAPDCSLWSNDQRQLCYSCESCQAAMLANLRNEWRKANVVLIIAAVVLIFIYIIGCSAFKNAQTEDLFRRYKQAYV